MSPQQLEILEKNGHGLTVLKMNPNRSSEQLMNSQSSEEQSSEDSCSTGPSIKDVKFTEWIVMFILCFVNLINYMDRFTLAGVLDDIQAHYDIKNDKAGLLQTSFIISYMIFAPLFGYLGDRYSRKCIMAIGVALWSATTLAGSYMNDFTWFMVFRAMVGIGEASYSTIAPTIISDLFIKSVRSKMLAFFYFAIPVGSGLGYIVGSETARLMGSWQWALRVTPGLGLIAVLLILIVLRDPERGQSEGSGHMEATSWKEDLVDLSKNKSFILSTAGFTCVAFVAGALAWWGPKFIYLGIRLQPGKEDVKLSDLSYIFGVITMTAGIVGLSLGCVLSSRFGRKTKRADPIICAAGLFLSAPCMVACSYSAPWNSLSTYMFMFLGQTTLNLNWAIVCDILLYCVLPTRRSTAEGLQLLASHALGDAGSPYLIGLISEVIGGALGVTASISTVHNMSNSTVTPEPDPAASWNEFKSLQYAIFITCFIEVLGGIFFMINSLYIVEDKRKVDDAVKNSQVTDPERRSLMP